MPRSENYSGQRLSFNGALCTVRYVGPIEGTEGDWLGIEWDEPDRGKHDGSNNGIRYFECSTSSTAASFIRPSRPSDRATGFFEALKNKYASSSKEDITATADQINISGKTVQEVGFEKIRRQLAELQELRIVVLDGACIATVESHLDQRKLKIIELDLSRNLLESWDDIIILCNSLNSLQCLRLDGNTLSRPQEFFENDEPHSLHGGLRELSLNNVGFLQQKATERNGNLPWQFIVNFTAIFPSLKTLSLASNNLTDIKLPLRTTHLTKLDLSSNAFTTLERIYPLSALPNLQVLSLRGNPLRSLASPPDSLQGFLKLKHLDLISTLLPTLPSLNPIPTSFPALKSLLTTHAPLTTYPSASLHTIARLSTLIELNYSPITPPERQNAELYYLSQISKQLAAAANDIEEREILTENPRWRELCTIHGEPTTITRKPTAGAGGSGTLAARVTAFTFYMHQKDLLIAQKHARSIPGHSSDSLPAPAITTTTRIPTNPDATNPPPTTTTTTIEKHKLIPRTVTTARLTGIVARLFDIRPSSLRLVWESEEWDPVVVGGEEEEEAGWSVSEDEDDECNDGVERKEKRKKEEERWKRREVELGGGRGMIEVGFWVEGREARVRVEVR